MEYPNSFAVPYFQRYREITVPPVDEKSTPWWDNEACRLLSSSNSLNDIILVCRLAPLRDSTRLPLLLAKRGNKFLYSLAKRCDLKLKATSTTSRKARVIAGYLRPSRLHTFDPHDFKKYFDSDCPSASTIAQEIDTVITTSFFRSPFVSWTNYLLESVGNHTVTGFLNCVTQSRNNLRQTIQTHKGVTDWECVSDVRQTGSVLNIEHILKPSIDSAYAESYSSLDR
jgi:hypothetical protein